MELVYLWVDSYKNIKNQGFNFSPRFECEFDGENLTINENKDYVSIFPENINITAIVGENGTGKSSLLVRITNHKALFKIGNEYFSRGFDLDKINPSLEIKTNDEDILKHIVYVDFDLIRFHSIKDFGDYTNSNIYDKNLYKSIENIIVGDSNFSISNFIRNFYNLIMEYKTSFESKLFFFNPHEIIFNDYLYEVNSNDPRRLKNNQLIKQVSEHPFSKERFLLFLFSHISAQVHLELPEIETIEDLTIHEEIIFKHAEYFQIENKQDIYSFFNALGDVQNKTQMLIEDFIPFYEKHKEAFLKLINIAYLQINFRDTLQREYSDLSQGERKLFTEMLMIFNAIKKNDNNDILVVLDEPDLTLHPGWQKKYINEMLKLLSNFSEKRFHFIITSHSPFILSDIPKESVIFLEKYKENDDEVKNGNQKIGNCKNATKDIDIKTFGANIHTLLSHGFFMSDGLMGEFAKSKITEILEYLNDTKNEVKLKTIKKEQIKPIIESIGEDFLRNKLLNMYNKKYKIKSKDDEIKELKEEIERLKNDRNKTK